MFKKMTVEDLVTTCMFALCLALFPIMLINHEWLAMCAAAVGSLLVPVHEGNF